MRMTLDRIDRAIARALGRYGHLLHRVSLGLVFFWFGWLKVLGHPTVASLLAASVYWGEPFQVLLLLGWWDVAIGFLLIVRPLVRLALVLLGIRVPGTLLAFVFHPEACFESFPWVPSPVGQLLLKDLVILFAAIAIGGSVRERSSRERRH